MIVAHPSVLDRLLPRSTVLANSDDNLDTVVAGVESLSVSLGTVTDDGEGVVLEELLELGQRPVGALGGEKCPGRDGGDEDKSTITIGEGSDAVGKSSSMVVDVDKGMSVIRINSFGKPLADER